MIISRTPFRISFVGGGSDLEAYYSKSPGGVLSATINQYMYISTHRFFHEDQLRVKYSRTETVANAQELKHPIVREVLSKFGVETGLEVSSNADIPAGTGLGSSSSFTVGLLKNFYARSGQYATSEQLAADACNIEINKLGEPIGKQDQYAAAFGGLNVITFQTSGQVDVEPVHLQKKVYKKLQQNLLMFYTGITRSSASILMEQKKNLYSGEKQKTLEKMVGLVDQLRAALYAGDLAEFGRILHRNWLLKQGLATGVTDSRINELYDLGLASGALGGKLLGAGGGGFLLFYCEEQNHAKLRAALSGLRELKFKLENEGAQIIHVGDEYD
jgi:D-glycero-alpha-D-manno-heptose-7-phosphate kinase